MSTNTLQHTIVIKNIISSLGDLGEGAARSQSSWLKQQAKMEATMKPLTCDYYDITNILKLEKTSTLPVHFYPMEGCTSHRSGRLAHNGCWLFVEKSWKKTSAVLRAWSLGWWQRQKTRSRKVLNTELDLGKCLQVSLIRRPPNGDAWIRNVALIKSMIGLQGPSLCSSLQRLQCIGCVTSFVEGHHSPWGLSGKAFIVSSVWSGKTAKVLTRS